MKIRSCNQRGFVLAATLWILALLTIAVTYFADRVGRSIAIARQLREAAEARIDFANTRAEILFRFATSYPNPRGLGDAVPTILDDRAYRGSGKDLVRLQDQRGLLNVNFVEGNMMLRLLERLGVPFEQRDPLLDTLRDYTDPDNLRRLNGAERADYEARGLAPPPNDLITNPQQLKSVIGWRDRAAFWKDDRLIHLITTAWVAGFNPNTAPLEALSSVPGLTPEAAREIIRVRAADPLYNSRQLPGYTPALVEPDHFIFVPSNSLRVTQLTTRLPWAAQWSVTLTPLHPETPWRIDYFNRTVVPYAVENEAEIPNLPPWQSPLRPQDSPL